MRNRGRNDAAADVGSRRRLLSERLAEIGADQINCNVMDTRFANTGIARVTVDLHLRGVRRKLRAATLPQAVAKACLFREISAA